MLHLITLVSDTVLSLAAFSGGTCNVFYWYIYKYINIYEYKSNAFEANVKKSRIKVLMFGFSCCFCFYFLGTET